MYQTFARIIGTIIATKALAALKAAGYLPAAYALTPEAIEYIGDGVLAIVIFLWSYIERRVKGQLPITIKASGPLTLSPGPSSVKPVIPTQDKIDS